MRYVGAWSTAACSVVAVGLTDIPSACAVEPQGGWYVGATLIGAYAEFDKVETPGFLGPLIEHDTDWVGGLGARVGYSWKEIPVRAEIELAHRYRFDLDAKDNVPAGLVDYESNIGTTSMLLTAIVEWRNDSPFRPFAGLAAGWAHHLTDTEKTDPTLDRRGRDRSVDNFAWGGVLGVDWDFSTRWTAEAAYRYLNMGKVTTGRLFTGERIDASDYQSHDLLLSILYRFPH